MNFELYCSSVYTNNAAVITTLATEYTMKKIIAQIKEYNVDHVHMLIDKILKKIIITMTLLVRNVSQI